MDYPITVLTKTARLSTIAADVPVIVGSHFTTDFTAMYGFCHSTNWNVR
jgi:hypothetical protein